MKKRNRDLYILRDLESVPFRKHKLSKRFRKFCQDRILPALEITGYKQRQKRRLAMMCVRALILASLRDKTVADSRDTANADTRRRVEIWNLLETAGFCKVCIGSQQTHLVTRYRATSKLMRLKKLWKHDLLQKPVQPKEKNGLLGLIVLKQKEPRFLMMVHRRKKQKKWTTPFANIIDCYAQPDEHGKPLPQAVANGFRHYRNREEIINQINSHNLDHTWKTTNNDGVFFQPAVAIRQLHIQEPERNVRLYTAGALGGQSLSKECRRRMVIDGEPVAELDFSGSIPRLAKHLNRIDVEPEEDVYSVDQIAPKFCRTNDLDSPAWPVVRNFIKRATLICFNTSSRRHAHQAINGLIHKNERRRFLWNVIRSEGFEGVIDFVDRIAYTHKDISGLLFCDSGGRLTTVESRIMLRILEEFVVHQNKPALPIHDALVVKNSDTLSAARVMAETYQDFVPGFLPSIKGTALSENPENIEHFSILYQFA